MLELWPRSRSPACGSGFGYSWGEGKIGKSVRLYVNDLAKYYRAWLRLRLRLGHITLFFYFPFVKDHVSILVATVSSVVA